MNWIRTLCVYMNICLNLLAYCAAIKQFQQQEHLYEQDKGQNLAQLFYVSDAGAQVRNTVGLWVL